MGTENFRVDKYQYEIHQDVVHSTTRELTLLYLFDQQRKLLCAIAFMPDGHELERPHESVNGHVAVQMHERSHSMIVDMLRNEKPVYFSWWREAEAVRLRFKVENNRAVALTIHDPVPLCTARRSS